MCVCGYPLIKVIQTIKILLPEMVYRYEMEKHGKPNYESSNKDLIFRIITDNLSLIQGSYVLITSLSFYRITSDLIIYPLLSNKTPSDWFNIKSIDDEMCKETCKD